MPLSLLWLLLWVVIGIGDIVLPLEMSTSLSSVHNHDTQKVPATEKKSTEIIGHLDVIVFVTMVAIVTAVNFTVPVVIKCMTTMH